MIIVLCVEENNNKHIVTRNMNWYRFWKSGTQRRPLRHPTQQRSLWWHALFYLNKLLAGGLNQANTVPFTPKRLENRDISIAWSSVSNAAERSNKSNMIVLLWSKEHKMWFCTLSSAVSCSWVKFFVCWLKRLVKMVGHNMFRQLNCNRLFNQLRNKL